MRSTLRVMVMALVVLALPTSPADAGDGPTPDAKPTTAPEVAKTPKTPKTRRPVKPQRLYGTSWYPEVEAALKTANRLTRKPVFLVRMLGKLDGKT